MHKEIIAIQISLTTFCNMKCPECCYGMQIIPKSEKHFVDWAYMENASKYFKGIDTINLTGGEATIHPKFNKWTPVLKELFECNKLTLDTNGIKFDLETMGYFDKIYVTRYHKDMFKGCPDNSKQIDLLQKTYGSKIHVNNIEHIPREKRGTKPCFRAYNGVLQYVNGKLYPCVTGAGLDTLVNIDLTDNWREEINKVHPPCMNCFFAEE